MLPPKTLAESTTRAYVKCSLTNNHYFGLTNHTQSFAEIKKPGLDVSLGLMLRYLS